MFTNDDIITTDKYLSLSNNNIIYLKTDLIYHGLNTIMWRGNRHVLCSGLIWITGHSDYPITEDIFKKYQKNCIVWYTINKHYKDDKLFALPLGITNDTTESNLHPIYSNTDIMMEVMNQPRVIQNLVYMNFSTWTYPMERQYCYNLFSTKEWVSKGENKNTLEGRHVFLKDLRNHKFVLCPRGNGTDTHRLWETLYMGSIPIVIKTVALDEFTDLPILFIENWEILNEEFLHKKYEEISSKTWNMEKLKFGYWKNKILNKEEEIVHILNSTTS